MDITFVEAIKLFYSRYTDFSGRSTRAEFWWIALYCFVGGAICSAISEYIGYVFGIVNIVPNIAIAIRRMHDIGKSGWWILINFIPLIGWIWYIVLCVKPSDGPNQWGMPNA